MPAHHKLEEYLDAYLAAAQIERQKKAPSYVPQSCELDGLRTTA